MDRAGIHVKRKGNLLTRMDGSHGWAYGKMRFAVYRCLVWYHDSNNDR